MTKDAVLEIQRVKLADVKIHPRNPRIHPKPGSAEWESLKASLIHDYFDPLVLNTRNNMWVSGHLRSKVLLAEGYVHADVVVKDYDEETHYARMIAANKQIGEFDFPALKDLMEEIDTGAFDMGLTGFTMPEIEDLMTQFHEPKEGLTNDDAIPDSVPCVVERGDLWILGDHRLLCGDATVITEVERLMGGEKADMVFTDPPYNVNYKSKHSGKIVNDNQSDINFEQFIRDIYSILHLMTSKNASIYICHASMVIQFDTVLREYDWTVSNKIIWVKDIPTYSFAHYKWQYEPIYFVTKGKPIWSGDKSQTNIWNIRAIQSAGAMDDSGSTWFKGGSKNLTLHPTQKPVALAERALINSSKLGSVILDPFGGSGSTLLACEKLDRKCYMMEIDEHYCDVIIKRWEDFTGRKAELTNDH